MPSRFSITSWALTLALSFCSGCTEKIPLSAVYSSDSDWNPTIFLVRNGYQRVQLTIDRPPRKELWRNISFVALQEHTNQNSTYVEIDSLRGYLLAPSDISPANAMPVSFVSKPLLNFDTDYFIRMAVHFTSGEIRYSNELSFKTPLEAGKIVKRISLRSEYSYYPETMLSCWRGSILAVGGGQLYRIDTSTGQSTLLKGFFYPPPSYSSFYHAFTVNGDSAFTFFTESSAYRRSHLVSLNLNTLLLDSSIVITTPGKMLYSLISHKGELYGLFGTYDTLQMGVISPKTGEVTRWFTKGPSFGLYPYGLASDGTNIFSSVPGDFNNLIVGRDPSTLAVTQQSHNPVFEPTGLAWDGSNFWVIDYETQSLVKLKLEGL